MTKSLLSLRQSSYVVFLLCLSIEFALAAVEVNLNETPAEWICPVSTLVGSPPLTLVPPSRVFAPDLRDQKYKRYCCPGEAVYIDAQGKCAENVCVQNGEAQRDFVTCPVVDSDFQFYSDHPRYQPHYPGSHRDDSILPNQNRKCCSTNAVCVKTANFNHSDSVDTNYQLLQRMFTCMVVNDPSTGAVLEHPFPQEAGIIQVKNPNGKQIEPMSTTLRTDAPPPRAPEGGCPEGVSESTHQQDKTMIGRTGVYSFCSLECVVSLQFYCPSASTRFACPDGKACPAGSTAPRACPEGSICFQRSATVKQFGLPVDKPSLLIPCSKLQRAVTCPGNSAHPVPTPKGFYLDLPSNKLMACKPGATCTEGSVFLVGCARGSYCPDGIQEIKCPKGHECQVPSLMAPIPCSAGTYQPVEGEAGLWGFYSAEKAPAKVRCQQRCEFGYQNADKATSCENVHPIMKGLIAGLTLIGLLTFYGIYALVFRWIPYASQQLRLRQVDLTHAREQSMNYVKKQIVDRLVLDVMLLPLSYEASKSVSSLELKSHSSSSKSDVSLSADTNLFVLAQYRSFLHTLLSEAIDENDCPPLLWIILAHPKKFQTVNFTALELSSAFKPLALEQYHAFVGKYCEAQAKLAKENDETHHKRSSSSKDHGKILVPSTILESMTSDIREALQSEFYRCIDGWIASQQKSNGVLQNMSSIFGGVHVPSRQQRHASVKIGVVDYVQFAAQRILNKCRCRCCQQMWRVKQQWNPDDSSRMSPIQSVDID